MASAEVAGGSGLSEDVHRLALGQSAGAAALAMQADQGGPPGLTPQAVCAATPPAVLSIPASFLTELVDTVILQDFEVLRSAKPLQGDELIDLCPRQAWSTWKALEASFQGLHYHLASEDRESTRTRALAPRCA